MSDRKAAPNGARHRSAEVQAKTNSKAGALVELRAIALIDDFLPYLVGLPQEIHTALVRSRATGSPNRGPHLGSVHSMHDDLREFARWWSEQ